MKRGLIFGLGAIGLVVAIGLTLAASAFADHGLQAGGDALVVSAPVHSPSPASKEVPSRPHSSSMGSAQRSANTTKHGKSESHGKGNKHRGGAVPSPTPPASGSNTAGGSIDGSRHVDGDD